jgi:murein DD-endopeptidase MepM/ murein hydrolase activator NlpD
MLTWFATIVMTAAVAATTGQTDFALRMRIVTPAAVIRPGTVMLVTVTGSQPLTLVEADAFKRTAAFWPTTDPTEWQVLVGVPLATPPGSHELTVHAVEAAGRAATRRLGVTIVPAQFETRRLRVDPRFVDPPAGEVERITREARTLADIFAQTSPGRLWSGPFTAPVPGEATSSFGRLTFLNGKSRGRHLGSDFRAAEGTAVVAPNAGRVVLAENYYFSGNTVILDHGDGLYSLIAHLSRIAVRAGAHVQRGDPIGDSGATGRVTGPHLHWAVRLRGDSVDPLSLVAAAASMDGRPPLQQ